MAAAPMARLTPNSARAAAAIVSRPSLFWGRANAGSGPGWTRGAGSVSLGWGRTSGKVEAANSTACAAGL